MKKHIFMFSGQGTSLQPYDFGINLLAIYDLTYLLITEQLLYKS